jgi:dienelactone hydrolase
MTRDLQVDQIFAHFTPRYIATGVDPNDLSRLVARIDRWADWCRLWSEAAQLHETLAYQAEQADRKLTAAEAWLRAAICYHYGKHLFGAQPDEYDIAHANMLRCYQAALSGLDPTAEYLVIPYGAHAIHAYLRRPAGIERPPVAIILPGLDAAKEELHNWSDAFLRRGMATVTLDGPGQGESAAKLAITPLWGRVIGAVLDVLEARADVDAERVGIVGQSLGAIYAPLAAAQEPRLKACIANCGPFNFGDVLPHMPTVSQDLFAIRAHLPSRADGVAFAQELNLADAAPRIKCPLLIVFGSGDRIIPPSEGERLAAAARGPVDYVVYEEGNHVCFNITYKFRPLTADWMAEHL